MAIDERKPELRRKEMHLSAYQLPEAAAKLPSDFEGYKVVIEQGDPIHAQKQEIGL